MLEYVKALIIKFIMSTAVIWLVLGLNYGVPFGHIIMLSLIITLVAFVLGDLMILPRFENWGATLADFLLVFAAVSLYSTNFTNENFPLLNVAATIAILISIGEIFFHKYVDRHILYSDDTVGHRRDNYTIEDSRLNTEFSKEVDPLRDDAQKKR